MIDEKEIKRIKKTFQNKGYVVLKDFMPKQLINEIKNDVKKLLKMKKIKNKLENIHYLKTKQLSSVHNIANYIHSLVTLSYVSVKLVCHYLHTYVEVPNDIR